MKLTPLYRLYGLGFVLLLALLICSTKRPGEPSFFLPLAVAGAAYLLALREFFCTAEFPKRLIYFGIALAALWHFQYLRSSPGLDDDIRRYLWDGRVQRLGYNPYLLVPSDPRFASLHTPETRTLNNPEVASPDPAGAQLFFRAVTAIHESTFALRVGFALCDGAIVLLLLDFLRRTGQPEHWVLAYAWHPLLVLEVVGSGHVDIVGVMLLLVSAAALLKRARTLAAVTFALAIAVKFLPIVLLPLYWRRVRVRDGALALLAVALLYLPFLNQGRIPFGSLGTYVQRFRFNDPVFATVERLTAPQIAAGMAVLAGFLTALWMRRKFSESFAEAFAWPMAASLVCAPVVYPWYLVWLLPFMRSISTLPIMIWTLSILPTYYVWHLRTLGRPWIVPDWLTLLEFGSVAVTAAVVFLLRLGGRTTALQCSADAAK